MAELGQPRWCRFTDQEWELLKKEAEGKGVDVVTILREIVRCALEPKNRKGESYGFYLKARDLEKARALLASLTLLVFGFGAVTLGLLASQPV